MKYYGNALLPDFPSEPDYPYAFIRDNDTSGNYDLIFSKKAPQYTNNGVQYPNDDGTSFGSGDASWYTLPKAQALTANWIFEQRSSTWWILDGNRKVRWSNFDILHFTTKEVYHAGSDPTTYGYSCTEVTSATSITGTIDASAGSWILASVVDRSTLILPSDWTLFHTSGEVGTVHHKVSLCAKHITETGKLTVTFQQSTAGRMYLNLIAFQDIQGFLYHEGSEQILTTTPSVTVNRPQINSLVWVATASVWDSTNPAPTWSIDWIQHPIQLETGSAPRLLNVIDDDNSAIQRNFKSGTTSDGAIIDYIEILHGSSPEGRAIDYTWTEANEFTWNTFSSIPWGGSGLRSGFLLKSGSVFYTTRNGSVEALTETELTKELFKTHGTSTVPTSEQILTLTDPVLLLWDSDVEKVHTITINMTAVPKPQTIYTDDFDMTDSSILGIEKVTATATDATVFAVSFDSGTTWKLWNGSEWATLSESDTGMSVTTLNAITTEQWNSIATTGRIQFRAVLTDNTATITSLVVDFLN